MFLMTCLIANSRSGESYRIAAAELRSLKDLKRSSNGFGSEMEEQKSRLNQSTSLATPVTQIPARFVHQRYPAQFRLRKPFEHH